MVSDPCEAARRLEDDGWVLDAGQAHRGQGTRNRRLAWPEQFFELLWVTDAAEARANPLRLDRRADWTTTGASPFGLAFRGPIDPVDSDDFWLYDLLGPRIWIHRDNERCPDRPLVFVLETAEEEMAQRRATGRDVRDRRASPARRAARSPRPRTLRAVVTAVRGTTDRLRGGPAHDGVGRRRRRLPPASQRRLGHARLKRDNPVRRCRKDGETGRGVKCARRLCHRACQRVAEQVDVRGGDVEVWGDAQ